MKIKYRLSPLVLSVFFSACATPPAVPPGDGHLQQSDVVTAEGDIPATVPQSFSLPKPKVTARSETYSVVVNDVRVQDLLFALARDANVNVDIHPGILGSVTLNAVDQTLPQILNRLAGQVDLRWELDGSTLMVMPDTPYLRNYKIDYVNMKRDASGSIQVSGEIAEISSGGGSSGSNGSVAKIDNSSNNHFWGTLIQNVKDMLRETDKIVPDDSGEAGAAPASGQRGEAGQASAGGDGVLKGLLGELIPKGTPEVKRTTFREAASVIANPETGILSVRATSRQHEKIQQFLDQVMASAKRQVMIEATIAEVELSQQYQQGVDWGSFASSATSDGLFVSQAGARVVGDGLMTLSTRGGGAGNYTSAAIRLLETFGTVKVLSSPKISAINNQSAILKVVDNQVYFNVKATTSGGTGGSPVITSYSTEQKVVPVGFVMNVTPQISSGDEIVLNVRPSITRILRFEDDPNPSLVNATTGVKIPNLVPVIRTREMESVIRVHDGGIAVMGGLMEDTLEKIDSAVPWFHSIPVFGALFSQKSSVARKTELVIFLRPTVIREAGGGSDFDRLKEHLPSKDFFANNPGTKFQLLPSDTGASEK